MTNQHKKIAPEGAIFMIPVRNFGGATQSRTGLDGFAIRCITALLSRQTKGPVVG